MNQSPTGASDLTLVRSASEGDRVATRQVLEAVAPSVLGTVRSVIGAAHPDVEDLVQESLIAVIRALPGFRGECSLLHFAKQIATRRAIDGLRATIRARRNTATLERAEAASSEEPTMDDRCRERWRELLAELPIVQGEALALRAIEGYSVEEIAEMTQAPLETVRSRLRLAKATLRGRISNDPTFGDLLQETET